MDSPGPEFPPWSPFLESPFSILFNKQCKRLIDCTYADDFCSNVLAAPTSSTYSSPTVCMGNKEYSSPVLQGDCTRLGLHSSDNSSSHRSVPPPSPRPSACQLMRTVDCFSSALINTISGWPQDPGLLCICPHQHRTATTKAELQPPASTARLQVN